MGSNSPVAEILKVALAVLASLGGGGAIVLALSSWIGKILAARILEREKAELVKLQDAHRHELQELAAQRQDALYRKRDVYTELATKMRVLLKTNTTPDQQEAQKAAFLAAYDKGYIWASEAVVAAIRDLIEALEAKAKVDEKRSVPGTHQRDPIPTIDQVSQELDTAARSLYQRCMIEMRRDSGFQDTTVEYRVISFG